MRQLGNVRVNSLLNPDEQRHPSVAAVTLGKESPSPNLTEPPFPVENDADLPQPTRATNAIPNSSASFGTNTSTARSRSRRRHLPRHDPRRQHRLVTGLRLFPPRLRRRRRHIDLLQAHHPLCRHQIVLTPTDARPLPLRPRHHPLTISRRTLALRPPPPLISVLRGIDLHRRYRTVHPVLRPFCRPRRSLGREPPLPRHLLRTRRVKVRRFLLETPLHPVEPPPPPPSVKVVAANRSGSRKRRRR